MNVSQSMTKTEERKVLVNLRNVKKITEHSEGSKITYMDGTTEIAKVSWSLLEATLLKTAEGAYRAPEPQDAH
jgi:hypothetical protein